MSKSIFAVILVLCLSFIFYGCGNDDEGSNTGIENAKVDLGKTQISENMSNDEISAWYENVVCSFIDCFSKGKIYQIITGEESNIFPTKSQCKEENIDLGIKSMLESGRVAFNYEKAQECFNALDELKCFELTERNLDNCAEVFIGSVPIGGACYNEMECKTGDIETDCIKDDDNQCGQCEKLSEIGESCEVKECVKDAKCNDDTSVCVENEVGDSYGSYGEQCDFEDLSSCNMALDLMCLKGSDDKATCQLVEYTNNMNATCGMSIGVFCIGDLVCPNVFDLQKAASGQVTLSDFLPSECVMRVAKGNLCMEVIENNIKMTECKKDLYCNSETLKCESKKEIGADCEDSEECEDNYYCGSNNKCKVLKQLGEDCDNHDDYCESNSCNFDTGKCETNDYGMNFDEFQWELCE